jgi:hypothetical protein
MFKKNKSFMYKAYSAIIIILLSLSACAQEKDKASGVSAKADAVKKPSPRNADFTYNAQEKRDPFIPLVSAEGLILEPLISKKKAGEVYVEGIIYDPRGGSYAVVNGEIVKSGDAAGDYRIIKIEPQKIILSKDGKDLEIELKREE